MGEPWPCDVDLLLGWLQQTLVNPKIFYTWIFLLYAKICAEIHQQKNLPKGSNFECLEDPGIKTTSRLVVFFPTHLKNLLVKLGSSSPKFRGENPQKIFELPPPRTCLSTFSESEIRKNTTKLETKVLRNYQSFAETKMPRNSQF